ncbi:DOMON-like domain-containing protein [Thauera butanivorans]|uniref:DOMON-like domain-containing protein n=1 Tax=Thauera butanivorans TaxID=86174 RepID=UPI0008392E21|nr:DOMON-like domain-containing protein [Thauera butanivorans]
MSLPTPERPSVPTITVGLRPHPSTTPAAPADSASPVGMLLATMYALPEGGAVFEFKLDGSRLDAIRIPLEAEPGAADELWKHTCFEAFVGVQGEAGYREFNFSPSGQWAIYDFHAPRERNMDFRADAGPSIRFERDGDTAWLEARVPAAALPVVAPGTDLDIGLAAVVERSDGKLEYWAVSHPAPQPDFHARNGFVLALATRAAAPDGKR